MTAVPSDDAPERSGTDRRLDLYRYAGADNATEYLAIMRLFTASLLADLSAGDVARALAVDGSPLTEDDVEVRCRQLVGWGNLVRSLRDGRVATVSEYLRSRSRYQVSPLGGRVHRQVDEILQATDGAREVARELLGGTVDALDRILALLAGGLSRPDDLERLAADVTGVFGNQRLFTESVAQFYEFLNGVLTRYDLATGEYEAFKRFLLDYIDIIDSDVLRHAPAVADRLHRLHPHRERLLTALDRLPASTELSGLAVERLPGRTGEDWDGLLAWYTGSRGRSGPEQLHGAAAVALTQLIGNLKRMFAATGSGVSRRGDLLRLAGWFAACDPEQAHRLYAATFGAYPARHLLHGPTESDGRASPADSWWVTTPVDVPVSLRERGDRTARGRTARVPDPGLEAAALEEQADRERLHRQDAAHELVAAGALDGAQLSPAARDLLLDRLGHVLAIHQDLGADGRPVTEVDSDLGLALTVTAGPWSTRVGSPDGDLTVHGLLLHVAQYDPARGEVLQEVAQEVTV